MDKKGISTVMVIVIIAVVGVIAFGVFLTYGLQELHIIPGGGSSGANVIVLGVPSQAVVSTLSGREAQAKGISYPINLPPNNVWSIDTLREYNVIILQGDPYFEMSVRELLKQYVDSGGKLIVVGDAGSKHPEYANVAGWSWPSGDGIPVPAEIIGSWAGYSDVSYGSELSWANPSHPIAKGMKLVGSQISVPSQVIKVTSKGSIIAAVETSEGSVPAIIEGGSGFGDVIYFSYDPGQTPEILLTTVKYLTGV